MNIQWYPGHMTKARRMMQEDIKLIDIVIELVDARLPLASKNPDIDELAKGKARLILLNKADMADPEYTGQWEDYFKRKGFFTLQINSRTGSGMKAVTGIVNEACREKIERDRKRGIRNRPIRAMIVGIPNVGKSTFINSYAGKACTKTGNKPGVTKGKQWIRLNKNVEMLDTPGILWPKFEDQSVGRKLAISGSIKDDILNITELAVELAAFLTENYPGSMAQRYGIEENPCVDGKAGTGENRDASETADICAKAGADGMDDIGIKDDMVKVLADIAIARCCLMKGGQPDIDKAAAMLIDDFRSLRLGRITLEFP